ncbi:hypothetical protein C8Q80DRAFT_108047 [Daedaleopsis nitida]|nr:hypothetical protein C8Q80DRAFT_108047 [Daedaleopsis nitida]
MRGCVRKLACDTERSAASSCGRYQPRSGKRTTQRHQRRLLRIPRAVGASLRRLLTHQWKSGRGRWGRCSPCSAYHAGAREDARAHAPWRTMDRGGTDRRLDLTDGAGRVPTRSSGPASPCGEQGRPREFLSRSRVWPGRSKYPRARAFVWRGIARPVSAARLGAGSKRREWEGKGRRAKRSGKCTRCRTGAAAASRSVRPAESCLGARDSVCVSPLGQARACAGVGRNRS